LVAEGNGAADEVDRLSCKLSRASGDRSLPITRQ